MLPEGVKLEHRHRAVGYGKGAYLGSSRDRGGQEAGVAAFPLAAPFPSRRQLRYCAAPSPRMRASASLPLWLSGLSASDFSYIAVAPATSPAASSASPRLS